MSDKAEKTRGAKVRASRAKSRVEAKKKSRTTSRAPGRKSAASHHEERDDVPRGKAEALESPAAQGNGQGAKRGRRQERPPARSRDEAGLIVQPAVGRKDAKRKRGKRGESAHVVGAPTGAVGTGADANAPHRPLEEKSARRARGRGRGGSAARTAVLGAMLVASLAALLWVYTGTGVLDVRQVEFTGNQKLQADYLRTLSGIGADTHLLKMDVKAVESALLSEPYIARVDITRHFPNSVRIEIVERRPSGYVLQNGKYILVDQEGMVLESADAAPPGVVEVKDLSLPLLLPGNEVSGIEFASVTSLIGSLPQALREKTTAVGLRGDGGLYITAGGTTVIYGEAKDFSRKNAVALMALNVLVQRYAGVEYIDVSYPEHPVIKPAGSA